MRPRAIESIAGDRLALFNVGRFRAREAFEETLIESLSLFSARSMKRRSTTLTIPSLRSDSQTNGDVFGFTTRRVTSSDIHRTLPSFVLASLARDVSFAFRLVKMASRHGNGSLHRRSETVLRFGALRAESSRRDSFVRARAGTILITGWPSLLLPSIPFASDILCAIRAALSRASIAIRGFYRRESPTRPARSRSLRLNQRKPMRGHRAFSDSFESGRSPLRASLQSR
jgi:hypothetical protein